MSRLFSLAVLLLAPALAALSPATAQSLTNPIAIDSARATPLGTVVTVAGYVTVSDQFGGPLYLQDGTAGMATYLPALHAAARVGDSVVVRGPLTEFGASNGKPGSGLFQISGSGTTYELFPAVNRPQTPRVITLADIDESLEGQLVLVQNVTLNFGGSFQANTNYAITDATGASQLRIDNDTDLVGAEAPQSPTNIIGVLSQYRGTYQILPRTTTDLGVEGYTIPGEDVPREATFEVGTWNLRWFGDPNERPDDDQLQLRNAVRVLREMQLDVVGLQEIANPAMFRQLVDSLDGYRGILAPISQTQKTAIVYNTATVDSVDAGFYFTTGDWASGRYPYAFTFDATVGGTTQRFTLLNLHAKATLSNTALNDYNRRSNDAQQLKAQLDARNPNDAVIVVGDFNDDVDLSTVQNRPSPYARFVTDRDHYRFLTESLSERGFQSISGGQMIDHILVTDEVLPFYFAGTERVENPSYVGSYLSTTSDHYPVWVRFDVAGVVAVETPEPAGSLLAARVTPSPSAGASTLRITSPRPDRATVTVFDVLGREVSRHETSLPGGTTPVHLPALAAAGLYFVQVATAHGRTVARWVVAR